MVFSGITLQIEQPWPGAAMNKSSSIFHFLRFRPLVFSSANVAFRRSCISSGVTFSIARSCTRRSAAPFNTLGCTDAKPAPCSFSLPLFAVQAISSSPLRSYAPDGAFFWVLDLFGNTCHLLWNCLVWFPGWGRFTRRKPLCLRQMVVEMTEKKW